MHTLLWIAPAQQSHLSCIRTPCHEFRTDRRECPRGHERRVHLLRTGTPR